MPEQFKIKLPGECQTLPEGFWSAIDVWIKKPHVVNKRLCGASETESKNLDIEQLRLLLDDAELFQDVMLFLSSYVFPEQTHELHTSWSSSVRTIIPKVNSYGTNLQKEIILKDFDRQQVTFLPFEQNAEGKVSFKKGNIFMIKLCSQGCEEWALELHLLTLDAWFADGIAYPKLPWLSSDLLPKLVRWATECKISEFRSTLSLLPVEKYSLMYQQLKEKYKAMVKVWPEVTDPEKFVYEDVAIATYLLVLWAEERAEKDFHAMQSFVDLGCGNGLLVHILTNEGHPGKGIDVRRRKIWDMYGSQTELQEKAIIPGESFLFPGTDWLIGNHSDELTPWIPVMAARSSYSCRYFVLPCCFFDFCGKYQRRQSNKSQYKEYIDFISEVCLVGKSRNYELADEAALEHRRARYIHSRQTFPAITRSYVRSAGNRCHGNGECDATWATEFQPRERAEAVRNCANLPREFTDRVVLRVANAILETSEGAPCGDWNQGGSLSVNEVAGMLERDVLQVLKKECGGLQTLLKNNHQVFRVESGRVYIRDWRDGKQKRAKHQKKPTAPETQKIRLCWFHTHHPQGCPLQTHNCQFAHGPEDLQPSSRPLKKKQTHCALTG